MRANSVPFLCHLVIIGRFAGFYGIGSQNVIIGNSAGQNLHPTNSIGNVFLGNEAGAYDNTLNKFYIANTAGGTTLAEGIDAALMYGDFSAETLRLNAELSIYDEYSFPIVDGTAANQVMITNGTGTLSWSDVSDLSDGDWTVSAPNMYSAVSGNVGIGTASPIYNLHVVGSSTLGSILIAPDATGANDAELILAEDDDYTMGMSIKYDGGDNKLYISGKSGATNYGPHLTIGRNNGEIGIGTTTPGGNLHINSDTDALLILEADKDDSGEDDNPRIEIRQDGGASVIGGVGFVGSAGQIYTGSLGNAMYMVNDFGSSPLQLGTNGIARLTIEQGGDIGIGTSTPDYKFEVEGSKAGSSVGDHRFISMFKNTGGVYSDGIKIHAGSNAATTGDVIYIYCEDGNNAWVGSIYSSGGTLMMNGKSASLSKFSDIKGTEKGLSIINNIQVVDYDYNAKSNTYKTGFVGEDVAKVFPAMVSYEEEADEYGVSNSALVPVLTKGMQEQQIQIDNQQSEIEDLKKQIQELKELIQNK